jgi:NAD(P)-dependent dehydrogenase (short-subunit alcohol dehydrogenase family)
VILRSLNDQQGRLGKALDVELLKLSAEAVSVQAEVRHGEEVRRLIDEAVRRFGRIDAAVDCRAHRQGRCWHHIRDSSLMMLIIGD